MSESTVQGALMTALAGVVRDGSIIVNDYHTPQVASRDYAPWLIIETADEVEMSTGASGTTPSVTYKIGVTLLVYRRGQSNEAHLNAFQALRQAALATLALTPKVRGAAALTTITPWFPDENAHDPDSLMQRLGVDMTEYEV